MEMQYRCEHCNKLCVLKRTMRVCPHCHLALPAAAVLGAPSPRAAQQTGRAPRSARGSERLRGLRPTQRRKGRLGLGSRRTRSPPPVQPKQRTGGRQDILYGYLERQGNGWVLRNHTLTLLRVEVGERFDPAFLEHRTLSFVVKAWKGDVPVIAPKNGTGLEQALHSQTRVLEFIRITRARSWPRFGPRAPGTSPLETMQGDLMAKAREIQRLAQRKDDHQAWSTLANGYRVPSLRGVLEQAMIDVGWKKIAGLVQSHPGDWPPELEEWLDRQRVHEQERQRNFKPMHARAWRQGEYGTVED